MAVGLSLQIVGLLSGFDVGQGCGHDVLLIHRLGLLCNAGAAPRRIAMEPVPQRGPASADSRARTLVAVGLGRERGGSWPPRLGSKTGRSIEAVHARTSHWADAAR